MSRAVQLVLLSVVILTCLETGVAQDVQNELSQSISKSMKPPTHIIYMYLYQYVQITQQVRLWEGYSIP